MRITRTMMGTAAALGLVAQVAQGHESVCHIRGSYNLTCQSSRTVTLGRLEFSPSWCASPTDRGHVSLVAEVRPGYDVHRSLTYGLTPDEYYPTWRFSRYITIFDESGRDLYHGAAGPFVPDQPICEGASAPVPCVDPRGDVAATVLLVRASGAIESCQAVRVQGHVQSYP